MKTICVTLLLAVFGLVFVGCSSTKPKVDWNARVGNFTYDQAIIELGPPDKSAKFNDGKTMASWIVGHRTGGTGLSVGTGFYGGGAGIGVSQSIGSSSSYDRVLTLTFDKDGKLEAYKKNY